MAAARRTDYVRRQTDELATAAQSATLNFAEGIIMNALSTANDLRRFSGLCIAAVAVTALVGCASVPPPSQQMAVAEASVQRATTTSTSENAGVELQVATAKLASARQALLSKDYDRARQLAEQADVDAQVAELRAQSARSRKAATESQDAARALREEISRKSAAPIK